MRSSALVAATLSAATLLAATLWPTRAGATATVQGNATASAGYSDNVLNAPDEATTTSPPREGDLLFHVGPGIVIASQAPRFLQRVTYNFAADLFVRHSEANSYTNTLGWTATMLTSPTTTLILTLTSVQGKVSTFAFNQASSGATIAVLPQNTNTGYFNQQAGESLEARPLAEWRVLESIRFSAFIPLDRGRLPDSYDVTGDLGFDRIFQSDALGLVLRADFIDYVPARDPTTDVPLGFEQRQVLTTLAARWRRDWSRFWSTEASLGVVNAVGVSSDPAASTQTVWEPSALAAVRWTKDVGAASLQYAHDVTPNTITGSTFSRDGVALQAGFPVLRAKMSFGATIGYQHARTLSLVAGAPDDAADLVLADATITWQPRPEVGLFARYAFSKQFGKPPFMDMPATLPDLTRNTVMIGVNVLYPAVATARVPSRPASRVDGADQAEFPELHAPEAR